MREEWERLGEGGVGESGRGRSGGVWVREE